MFSRKNHLRKTLALCIAFCIFACMTSFSAAAFEVFEDGGKYLESVTLTLSNNIIGYKQPVVGYIEALYNTGETVDLTQAGIEYILSDNRLSVVEGSNTIILSNPIGSNTTATVKAKVTVDGITVESEPVQIQMQGSNIAGTAEVSVISVRMDGSNIDARYTGDKAVDGERSTSWASDPEDRDNAPWIKLDFGIPVTIAGINLVDRGHKVNQIGEGVLEWEGGSMLVEGIEWEGQPDNIVMFEEPVTTSWIKFIIDPENKFPNEEPNPLAPGGIDKGELGLAEFEVFAEPEEFVKRIVDFKYVSVDTIAGVIPELPGQVYAVYNDGSVEAVNVVWDAITEDMVEEGGTFFIVNGTVEGTDVKAAVTVRVNFEDVVPFVILSGDDTAKPGDTYTATLIIDMPENAVNAIYAQDITITYDPDVFEFTGVENVIEGLNVQIDSETPGTVRILFTNLGSQYGIITDTNLLDLLFAIKDTQSTRSGIFVTEAILADGEGIEIEAETSSIDEIQIIKINEDVNGDGNVSIGDLAIVGRFFGKDVSQTPEVAAADIDFDGVVGLKDIILVARKILGK